MMNVRQSLPCALALAFLSCSVEAPGEDGGGTHFEKMDGPVSVAVPPGMMMPYAGNTPPQGWMLCDGKAISRDEYPALFNAIGSAWGTGGDGDGPLFNLPDLRGRFLRGVDRGAARDPDRDSRLEIQKGGNTGDLVGSLQKDATRLPRTPLTMSTEGGHRGHWTGESTVIREGGSSIHFVLGRVSSETSVAGHTHTLGGGDPETRPENAAVNWLIKY